MNPFCLNKTHSKCNGIHFTYHMFLNQLLSRTQKQSYISVKVYEHRIVIYYCKQVLLWIDYTAHTAEKICDLNIDES